MTYAIKDWERHFFLKESAKHAEVTWTKFPVSTESISYKRLMAFREGRDAYCVFVAIVQMVARKRLPGVLKQGDTSIEVDDIALATGFSPKLVQASIERLALPTIGWLRPVCDQSETDSPPVSNRPTTGQQPVSKRQKTALEVEEEEERDKDKDFPPAAAQLPPASLGGDGPAPPLPAKPKPHPVNWDHLTGWRGIDEKRRADWAKAFPACDIDRQLAAMHAWLTNNPAKARKSNYGSFITRWLGREQDRGGDMRSNGYGQAHNQHTRQDRPAAAGNRGGSIAGPAYAGQSGELDANARAKLALVMGRTGGAAAT